MTVLNIKNVIGKKNFKSFEMFMDYKYIEYVRKVLNTKKIDESIKKKKNLVMIIHALISTIPFQEKTVIKR